MDFRSGIFSTAKALGIDPHDLATAISYETAGTFDPTKKGPTTQWGQHRGLIQFGEPQAKKYGVNWADPVGSQLGPNGAVANYLRDTGVKPGMGLMDIYSAINAGGVGRYNRSDANNGGAPGTVADKVNNQMAGHRRKAEAFLGGKSIANDTMAAIGKPSISNSTSTMSLLGGLDTERPEMNDKATGILGSLFPNMTAEKQDRIVLALGGLSMNPNQGLMNSTQARMGDRRVEQSKAKDQAAEAEKANRTAQMLQLQGAPSYLVEAAQNGYAREALSEFVKMKGQGEPTGTANMQEYAAAVKQGYAGTIEDWIMAKGKSGAASTVVNNSLGGSSNIGTIPQGYAVSPDPTEPSGYRMHPVPGGPEDTSGAKTVAASNAAIASDTVTSAALRARDAANARNIGNVGAGIVAKINPYSDSAEVERQVEVLKSNAKIGNLTAMREASPTGGALGAVSDKESEMLAAKSGALNQDSPNFERDLADYTRTLLRVIHGNEAGDAIFQNTWSAPPPNGDDDGWQTMNGVRIRVKQ